MNHINLCTVAALSATVAGSAFAQDTLDDFGGDTFIMSVPDSAGGPFTESMLISGDLDLIDAGANLFGDERTFTIDIDSGSSGTSALSILGVGGVLAFDTGISAGPGDASFDVVYDDFTDVDVTDGGANGAFAVGVLAIDHTVDFSVTLDDGVNSGSGTVTASSAGTFLIDLSGAGFAGVDLTSIDTITFSGTNVSTAADVAIDRIGFTVIPEPGSLALVGLGGLAMLRRRR